LLLNVKWATQLLFDGISVLGIPIKHQIINKTK